MLISGIYTREGGISDPEQLLLTEALDIALRKNCTYAIFHQPSQIHPEYAVTGVLNVRDLLILLLVPVKRRSI